MWIRDFTTRNRYRGFFCSSDTSSSQCWPGWNWPLSSLNQSAVARAASLQAAPAFTKSSPVSFREPP